MIFLNIRRRGNFSQKTYKIIKDENKYDFENQIFFICWGGGEYLGGKIILNFYILMIPLHFLGQVKTVFRPSAVARTGQGAKRCATTLIDPKL